MNYFTVGYNNDHNNRDLKTSLEIVSNAINVCYFLEKEYELLRKDRGIKAKTVWFKIVEKTSEKVVLELSRNPECSAGLQKTTKPEEIFKEVQSDLYKVHDVHGRYIIKVAFKRERLSQKEDDTVIVLTIEKTEKRLP